MKGVIENPELELAYRYVEETGCNLFLTGKAGTGKTTFLHRLRKKSPKRMVVLAPTGVAAINAGGVTIHSFFQLPFSPFVPGTEAKGEKGAFHRISKNKINIIRSLDLLVIDEISMVRSDLLDAIDNALRRRRRNDKPFGGVQLLMIGDMQQLSPVVKDEERELLKPYYKSPYFFDSNALKASGFTTIELKHIYRQQDPKFITLLNAVRENRISEEVRQQLNQRYIPDFKPKDDEEYIVLTTHNEQARQINHRKMEELSAKMFTYDADIKGTFPEYSYPTDLQLELKEGAQVMFVKNDSSFQKRFFNGKIGVITDIDEKNIEVTCQDDDEPILVKKEEWKNTKYVLNEQTKEIEEEVIGTFTQYPLKTAWAITIHKSQGLTFDRAVIDANAAFAHGQVYVALSRCRSMEGMVLSSPISSGAVINDWTIRSFSKDQQQPTLTELEQSAKAFYQQMLLEQFDFVEVKNAISTFSFRADSWLKKIYPEYVAQVDAVLKKFSQTLLPVSEQFQKQLKRLLYYSPDYANDSEIKERISKGCGYFLEQCADLESLLEDELPDIDNADNLKNLTRIFDDLKQVARVKMSTLRFTHSHGFSVMNFLNIRAKSTIDDDVDEDEDLSKPTSKKKQKVKPEKPTKATKESVTKDDETTASKSSLYKIIRDWRNQKAEELEVPVYTILHQKAVVGIVQKLPQNSQELLKVKGIGKAIVKKYGEELLQMVEDYLQEQE